LNATLRKSGSLLVVAVAVLSAAPALAQTAAPTAAATGAYINTFSLPATPATTGTYQGVDPTGANIVMWDQFTGGTKTALQTAIDSFNKSNPWKIQVTAIAKGNYGNVYQAVLGGIQTKSLPNFSVAYQNQSATYQTANVVLDMNPLVDDAVYGLGAAGKADFVPGLLAQDVNPQYNNQRLGFPEYRSLEVMYVNNDALTKLGVTAPPKTWDEFKTVACQYFKVTGNAAYQVRTDASWVAGAAFAQGGDIYDYATNKFTYDSAAAQVAPQVMQDLLKQGCVALIANPDNFSDETDFGAGKSLFYGGSSSGLNYVKLAAKTANNAFALTIAPLPYKDQPISDIYGASWSIFASGNKAQDLASWLFMRWFSEPEQQAPWAIASGYFPVRLSTQKVPVMATYLAANADYASGLALLKNTKAEPPVAGYDPVRVLAGGAMNDVLDQKPVKATFDALNTKANQILSNFKPNLVPATPKPASTAAATMAATMSASSATMAPTMAATK